MTPMLRFHEFTNEWQTTKLGDFAKFFKGSGISKDDIVGSGEHLAIRYGELYTIYNELISDVQSRTDLPPNTLVFSNKNDVIIPSSGETHLDIATASCVAKDAIAIGGDINIIRSPVNGIFLAYYLNNKKRADIARLAQGVSVVHLYSASLKELLVSLPEAVEQQKIADFLTVVDEKIVALERKAEKLQDYKRGMMQKIFSQQIRFTLSDGSSFPDWKEKKLGYYLHERKESTSKGGALEHVSLTTQGVVPKNKRYERDFLVRGEDKQYKITRINDIVYNPANLKFGVIARNKYKDGIFSPIYVTYLVRHATPDFMEFCVTSSDFIQKARKYEQGTVYERMSVSSEDLLRLDIKLPEIEEQQKIAGLLSAIDAKIILTKSQAEKTKEFKKGLLQRMFV